MHHSLDDLLDESAPPAPRDTTELRMALDDASSTAKREVRKSRPTRRGLFVGLALSSVLLAGAGVAVATELIEWPDWAADPTGAYTFVLPSGVSCDVKFGNVLTYNGERRDELRADLKDWFEHTDIVAEVTPLVNDFIEESRAGTNIVKLDDGTEVDGGVGTEYYDADDEYQMAFNRALNALVYEEVARLGYPDDLLMSSESASFCPGRDE